MVLYVEFFFRNPFPGTLINHPDGDDVYKGVPKDYTGEASIDEFIHIDLNLFQRLMMQFIFSIYLLKGFIHSRDTYYN